MNRIRTSIITLLLWAVSVSAIAQGFKITGKVSGLAEGTWLYLRTARPDVEIDSAKVSNGTFKLSGKVKDKATQVYLHTAKYTNYVSFWIENSIITVNVKAGEFKKAIITGSAVEEEHKLLEKLEAPAVLKQDSLGKLLEKTTGTPERKKLQDELRKAREQEQQIDINYVKMHPGSVIAANLLSVYTSTWGKETSAALFNNLSTEMKNTSYGKDIQDYISLNKDVKVGDKFTDFEQLNPVGKAVKLSDIKAKYILLEFWASWCGPCRESNPALVKTYAAFKDKGFEILGVSLDDNKSQWLKAIKDDNLPWQNVGDLKGDKNRAALIYGISAIPGNFLIDQNGIIIAKNLRGEALDKKLQGLFGGNNL